MAPVCLDAMSTLGDSATPIYEFVYDDGTVRRTDDDTKSPDRHTTAIETLALLGREDPECEVTLVGFE